MAEQLSLNFNKMTNKANVMTDPFSLWEELSLPLVDRYLIKDLLNLNALKADELELQLLLTMMFVSLNQGSICLKFPSQFEALLQKYTRYSSDEIARLIHKVKERLHSKEVKEMIGVYPENLNCPIIHINKQAQWYLYFQKYFKYEHSLKQSLQALLMENNSLEHPLPKHLDAIIHKVLVQNPILDKNQNPLLLNPEQKAAVILSLLNNFLIISGGPGTGKTSIVSTILRCLIELDIKPERIKIAAPTGRAAQRITDSIIEQLSYIKSSDEHIQSLMSIKGSTIHRLLQYSRKSNQFYYNKDNPLTADVLIVDEVSMVDVQMMSQLLSAIKPSTKLILLGDKNQLPSVEAGAVLTDLIPKQENIIVSKAMHTYLNERIHGLTLMIDKKVSPLTNKVVFLKKSYRFKPGQKYGIYQVAGKINDNETQIVDQLPIISLASPSKQKEQNFQWFSQDSQVTLIPQENLKTNQYQHLLYLWIQQIFKENESNKNNESSAYQCLLTIINKADINDLKSQKLTQSLNSLFNQVKQFQILTLVRRGLYGSIDINRYLMKKIIELDANLFSIGFAGRYFNGMPIIINRNDYIKELYNGDTGIVIKTRDNYYYGVFCKGNQYRFFPMDSLVNYEPAFSITVHKSQGSEYNNVLLIFPNAIENPLLNKEMIYTGLTRAKDNVFLLGKREIIKQAISQKIERESGMDLW